MTFAIHEGVWPVMITPWKEDNTPDFKALEALTNWYVERELRRHLRRLPVERDALSFGAGKAGHRALRIGSRRGPAADRRLRQHRMQPHRAVPPDRGHDEDPRHRRVCARVQPDGHQKNEGEEAFRKNVDDVLAAFPEISFGIYECPMPWKRLLTLDFIRDYAPGGRLVFIKDTCCDYELIRRRLEAAKGTPMKLFNANCQSWYDSYCHGAGGYSGIMANFHPDIYKYCVTHKDTDPEKVQHANDFLTLAGMIERTCYPVSCKYYHQLVGVPMSTYCRSADPHRLDNAAKEEVEALIRMENHIREELGIG